MRVSELERIGGTVEGGRPSYEFGSGKSGTLLAAFVLRPVLSTHTRIVRRLDFGIRASNRSTRWASCTVSRFRLIKASQAGISDSVTASLHLLLVRVPALQVRVSRLYGRTPALAQGNTQTGCDCFRRGCMILAL